MIDTKFKAVVNLLDALDLVSDRPEYTDEQQVGVDDAFARLNDFRKAELPPDVEVDTVS